jgi:hypothetical protein
MESFGRKAMKRHELPAPASGRQMNLLFDTTRLDGLDPVDRSKAILALAQLLMQAAGVRVEEFDDGRR